MKIKILREVQTGEYFVGYVKNSPKWSASKVEAFRFSGWKNLRRLIWRLKCQDKKVEEVEV